MAGICHRSAPGANPSAVGGTEPDGSSPGMHREPEPPEAFREHLQHPVGVRFLLDDDDHVVRVADEDAAATEAWLHLRREPYVEDIVEVDVRQQRRHDLWVANS